MAGGLTSGFQILILQISKLVSHGQHFFLAELAKKRDWIGLRTVHFHLIACIIYVLVFKWKTLYMRDHI